MATRVLKSCGHYCYPSKLEKCCACEDIRPISKSGFYERYIDGEGWSSTATRNDGYCPVCNTNNYEKWKKKVRDQTMKKALEEEEKKEQEAQKLKVLEDDRKRMDTGDDQVHADTTIQYTNGDIYVGDVVRGQPHGNGRMEYADNDDDILSYEGGWNQGKHEGQGKKVWMDDTFYQGSWHDGMMHGHGTYHVNQVDVMVGTFQEDVFQD